MLKRKKTQQGHVERYKARLVAKCFTQRKGIAYDEVFASVVKHATVRAMLALAAVTDYDIEQIDVKMAFLNGPLDEEIYIEVREEFDFGEGNVLMLKKALYTLKQAARAWHQELKRVLQSYGFEVSRADSCLFVFEKNGSRTYLMIYVDDGLIIGHKSDVKDIIQILEKEFDIRKLGEAAYFLAMEILRVSQKKIYLSQVKYAEKMLQRTGMIEAKSKSIPLAVNLKLSSEGEDLMEEPSTYAEVLGMLLYLATCTRPDIAHAVGLLARFMAKPRQEHWRCIKWLLQYLNKTQNLGLH